MESIGDTLRNARLRRGIDLEQVVAATKIRLHHLEAMEADQFERLPGGLFARSFLQQYARLLDLDERALITSLDQQFKVPDPAPEQGLKPDVRPSRHAPAFVWMMLALASLAAFHLWDSYHNRSLEAGTRIGICPSTGQASREAVAPAPPPATPPPATPQPQSQESGPMHVALTATEPVWVSVKWDGGSSYTGTLDVQQSREIDFASEMAVLVGNAGGLRILLNGRPVGPIGARGQVQSLRLTPAGVRFVPRTSPSPSEE
jgi:cytoskeleton protein RodZ